MFCPNCGNYNNINDNSNCLYCGSRLSNNNNVVDKSSVVLNVLSFFIPIIGIVLFFILKEKSPIKARKCGISAIIGVVSFIVLFIISNFFISKSMFSHINDTRKESLSLFSKEINHKITSKYYIDKINGKNKNCYTISELYDGNSNFQGSVSVKEDGSYLDIKMWINFDDVSIVVEYDNEVKISEEFFQDSMVNLICKD